ncbi:MAG TPA: M20 family metallopeptidase [Actinomycetota bacterium]|nr:M20 family metallopeptidase [Actinomycetota bacterium]
MPNPELTAIGAAVRAGLDGYLEDLRSMVGIDCGTYTPEGVNRVADRCVGRFEALGFEVDRRRHLPADGERQLGDCLIGRGAGPGPRVLLIGHMDTVFEEGTAADRAYREDGGRAFGPGVSDMKGGLLAGFLALEALAASGTPVAASYVCNPDEEIGSVFSKAIIEEVARDADVCFVLECARANGNVVSARKGITDLRIDVAGRAAHAGVEPQKGRNAIHEAAHKVLALQALNGRWDGITVNVGVIDGGTRPNVVPDRCSLEIDIRSPRDDLFVQAIAEATRIAETNTVPDVVSTARLMAEHRPMEKTPAAARLVGLARSVAGELGFDVADQATGGASDANTTSAMGVPTLDGLGPIGGDAHGAAEWLDLTSVVPRTTLLAGLIARAGEALGASD